MTTQPVLSICIPTYNRAELLRSALWALAPQIQRTQGRVEVIVSDNCSTDHTPEVVNWARQHMPVRYHRNEENIGATRNVLYLTNHLAQGEFGWVLGDDDLVLETGVESVLQCILSNPDIDYLFVNFSSLDLATRQNRLVTGADFSELGKPMCTETNTFRVPQWEMIIGLSKIPSLFTSIVSHVFRISMWKSIPLKFEDREPFDSLENTYPHACIIARGMVGKPAVYLGYPHVIQFTGSQEWFDGSWPVLMFTRVLELSDLLADLGVDGHLVDLYRNLVFEPPYSDQLFFRLLNGNLPGRKYFSLTHFMLRYGKYRDAKLLISRYAIWELRRRVLSPVKQSLLRALRTGTERPSGQA